MTPDELTQQFAYENYDEAYFGTDRFADPFAGQMWAVFHVEDEKPLAMFLDLKAAEAYLKLVAAHRNTAEDEFLRPSSDREEDGLRVLQFREDRAMSERVYSCEIEVSFESAYGQVIFKKNKVSLPFIPTEGVGLVVDSGPAESVVLEVEHCQFWVDKIPGDDDCFVMCKYETEDYPFRYFIDEVKNFRGLGWNVIDVCSRTITTNTPAMEDELKRLKLPTGEKTVE